MTPDLVAREYAMSAEQLRDLLVMYHAKLDANIDALVAAGTMTLTPSDREQITHAFSQQLGAPYLVMIETLMYIDSRWGSVVGYLIGKCCLSMDEIRALRDALTSPAYAGCRSRL